MAIEIPKRGSTDSRFETLWLHCIERIARGSNRDVYAIPEHDEKILKVANRQVNFANWSEIITHQHRKEAGDLAEIFSWSWSGKFIVMERLSPLGPGDFEQYSPPEYLTDRKPENFGRDSGGRIKVLDYASLKSEGFPMRDFA